MTSTIVIFVRGPFRVVDAEGNDLTPSSTKAQGLLVLLALSPNRSRTRRWLQDKLWSDRGFEQGAGSLRQTLTHIRKAFGDFRGAICADRNRVWLDDKFIRIDDGAEGEVAEGLDVRDQEFESWLTLERSRKADGAPNGHVARVAGPPPDTATEPMVLVELPDQAAMQRDWVQTLFADAVVRLMRETYSAKFVRNSVSAEVATGFSLRLESQRVSESTLGFRASLSSNGHGTLHWSDHCAIEATDENAQLNPAVAFLAWEAGEAFGEALLDTQNGPSHGFEADILCRCAVRRLFSMRQGDAAEADTLFAQAIEFHERGLFHAWRAQVRTIQRIERYEPNVTELREQGRAYSEKAMELEPRNSWVLALVANTHLFLLGEPAASFEYAERAVSINPANPMAWWALSSAHLYNGEPQRAYDEARHGRNLASRSPFRFWWDLQQFAAAMMLGRTDEAIALLESCRGQRTSFRPPLRYLAALRATSNDERSARKAVDALSSMEVDFSVDRLINDREYPASLVHSAEVIDLKRMSSILS